MRTSPGRSPRMRWPARAGQTLAPVSPRTRRCPADTSANTIRATALPIDAIAVSENPREDPGAHHGADPDEGRLPHRQPGGGIVVDSHDPDYRTACARG